MNGLDFIEQAEPSAGYICSLSGQSFPLERPLWANPETGAHLMLPLGQGLDTDDIDQSERSLWRYGSALRVARRDAISLGEGWTPISEVPWNGRRIHLKAEYFAPSGSFKDRGTAVMISYLRAHGITEVMLDSSGNAGASVAAYAAAAGMSCRIFVPAATSSAKIAQIMAVGAEVVAIAGSRQDVADAALGEADTVFFASHNWQPFFLEGTKTLAYEIWEQLGFRAPDAMVVPFGYGSNLLGPYLGFRELQRRGMIAKIPKLFAVQAANCAPLHAAFEAGAEETRKFDPKPTMAEGIASSKPVRSREALAVIRATGGCTVAVTEDEIAAGLRALAERGFFVEPTSATIAPAIDKLIADGSLAADDTVVAVLTGTGLKASDKISSILGTLDVPE